MGYRVDIGRGLPTGVIRCQMKELVKRAKQGDRITLASLIVLS